MKTVPHSRGAWVAVAVLLAAQMVPSLLRYSGSSGVLPNSPNNNIGDLAESAEGPVLPVFFEENRGQADSDVKFVGRATGFALLMKQNEIELASHKPTTDHDGLTAVHRVSMKLAGDSRRSLVAASNKQNGHVNYLIGQNESEWVRNVDTYGVVTYAGVYPGIDLIFHANEQNLEYDFDVAPNANPQSISLRFDGIEGMRIDSTGALLLSTPAGQVKHQKPFAYQNSIDGKMPVPVEFSQLPDGTVGFKVGDYDRTKPLVIDPTLVFSSYLGGAAADTCRALSVPASGDVVLVAGDSSSSDFLRNASANNSDVFVGRLTKNGGQFSYTFFGGAGNDTVSGFALDSMGNGYLAGSTESADFPLFHSFGSALAGPSDAFVALLNPEGNAFLYSSIIGGSGQEQGVSVAADGSGNAYITGRTTSTDFPLQGAIQGAFGGGDSDAFVTKLSTDGATLVYSTYLGGTGTEDLLGRTGIVVDGSGNALVVGQTQSTDFPTKDALRSSKTGGAASSDGFVTKINAGGSDLVFSSYLGGSDEDSAIAIALDQNGNIYISGSTKSTSFTGSAATRPTNATSDAFALKMNSAGSAIAYLTFFGGSAGNESANALAVTGPGVAVIAGSAGNGAPTVNAIQSFFKGGADDAFVARLATSGAVNFSTYLGGSADDVANGVGIDSDGHIFVGGFTESVDFLTFSALRSTNSGARDMFFARIDPDETSDNPVLLQSTISGKQLIINGQNFDSGAKLRINDEQTKTRNGDPDPTQVLIAKKGAKLIAPGQTVQLQVVNANGKRSNLLFITKPL